MIHQFDAIGTNANLNFEINLTPDRQVYCFIGENGCGKTNLLENIAKSVLCAHASFVPTTRDKSKYNYLGFIQKYTSLLSSISSRLNLPKQHSFIYNDGSVYSSNDLSYASDFDKKIDKPIIFISAQSRGHIDNITNTKHKSKEETFSDFFTHFFKSVQGEKDINQSAVADWIFERIIVNNDFIRAEDKRDHEVRTVLELLEELEPAKYTGISKKKLSDVFSLNNAQLSLNDTPIDKLSTGYISIIKLFQEIIGGYGAWLSLLGNKDIRNAAGIVFIDEIEAHLHAKWQYEIIPLLKRFFPKTTFYVATHSPLIVSTTNKDEAYELIREGNNVVSKNLGNPKNWYWSSLLTQAFHVPLEKKQARETENGGITLSEQLHDFSSKVKAYKTSKESALKTEILSMYDELLPNFTDNDPRLKTMDALKSLVL